MAEQHIRQQIIRDRVDEVSRLSGVIDKDAAFLRLVYSLVTGAGVRSLSDSDLTDGGQDKQLDIVSIEEGDDEAIVYIIQAKNVHSFESNALIRLGNGLEWLFSRSSDDVKGLANVRLRDKIAEVRSVLKTKGPSNVRVQVVFATNGSTANLSREFSEEMDGIRRRYDNDTFSEFALIPMGYDELVDQINSLDKRNKKIDRDIIIKYDTNNPSLIRYYSHSLKGMICSASGDTIADIVNDDKSGYVFDSNIRRFLGSRGAVNADIQNTCTDSEQGRLFWFLNNGITVVCDHFDFVSDPDEPLVKLKNMQIVNGCQTATTLAQAARDGRLSQDVWVLMRVYEAPSKELVDKIVLTTNNQNKIGSRDLRANDGVQVDMEKQFVSYGLHYERKARQFDSVAGVNLDRIATNDIVAQSYLAIVLKRPSDARRRKYKVWGEMYDKIFSGKSVESYVLAYLLYQRVQGWLEMSGKKEDSDDMVRRLAKNGAFHIARAGAYLWRGGDNWNSGDKVLVDQISVLDSDNRFDVDAFLDEGMKLVLEVILANRDYSSDLIGALKSNTLDSDLDKRLYRNVRS